MLTRDKTGLKIFDKFIVDTTLLKYSTNKNEAKSTRFVVADAELSTWDSVGSDTLGAVMDTSRPWFNFNRIFSYLRRKSPEKVDVVSFFDNIKNSIHSEEFDKDVYQKRVDGYISTLESAKRAGQVSFVETLQKQLNIINCESALFATGNVTTITEQQVVTLYKESVNGIRLDWIKNFNRVIPELVLTEKLKVDALNVFDNYVVLHYDPELKSYKETEAEKEARKDPILFGVIKGVNKLYYIADWIDDYCDLTLNTLIDKFGEDTIKSNNINVKF